MNKILYILFFILLTVMSGNTFGQSNLQKAIEYYQNSVYDSAKIMIDEAVKEAPEDPYAWHVRGFVYKDIFKKIEKENENSSNREEAINSFYKSMQYDTTNEFKENNRKAIIHLTKTYWNDAVRNLDTINFEKSIKSFAIYKKQKLKIQPNTQIQERETQYKNAIAGIYSKKYENDKKQYAEYWQKALDMYQSVLDIDSNNYLSNYNIGILYYNKGVDIILSLDPTTDLEQLMDMEEQTVILFQKSLPYMLKAHRLNSTKKETIIGLAGIYYNLNEKEKSEFYNSLLENIEENEENK